MLSPDSPLVPGHEIVGKVAAVGTDVQHWKDGDRVGAGWHGGHDGTCKACKKGMFQMCGNRQIHGETIHGGCKLQLSRILQLLIVLLQTRSIVSSDLSLQFVYPITSTLPNMLRSCVLACRASTQSAT